MLPNVHWKSIEIFFCNVSNGHEFSTQKIVSASSINILHVPISQKFYNHNLTSVENYFHFSSIIGFHIITKFHTCHGITVVMSYAKFHNDQICIMMEQSFVKWAPGLFHWHLGNHMIRERGIHADSSNITAGTENCKIDNLHCFSWLGSRGQGNLFFFNEEPT